MSACLPLRLFMKGTRGMNEQDNPAVVSLVDVPELPVLTL